MVLLPRKALQSSSIGGNLSCFDCCSCSWAVLRQLSLDSHNHYFLSAADLHGFRLPIEQNFSAPEKVFAEMVRCDCLPRFWHQHHVNSLSFGKPQFIAISGLPFKPSRSRSAGFGQSTCRSHSYLSSQVAEAGELGLEQQFHGAHRSVAVLGHDHFGDAAVGSFGVVILIAVDHQHQIGVLLN